jgi:predicted permease
MSFSIRPHIRRAFRLALRRRDLTRADTDEEMGGHLALRIAQLEARGLTRERAEREARLRFGGSWEDAMNRVHDAARSRDDRMAMRERLDAWWSDVGYAGRALRRQPVFAVIVVATFALGIGANATMFAVTDRLLLRLPPEVGDPRTLLEVSRPVADGGVIYNQTAMPYPLYAALRADSMAFRDVAASSFITTQSIGGGADAQPAQVVFASSNYFRVLETRPALGRLFGQSEDGDAPSSDVAVLSHGFWQRRFDGDLSILGKTIRIGPRDFTVVGVTRPGFTGVDPLNVDVWLPLSYAPVLGIVRGSWTSNWGQIWLGVVTRLQAGVAPDMAALRAFRWLTDGLAAWDSNPGKGAGMRRMADTPFEMRSTLPSARLADDPRAKLARLLVGVTAVVLLIACANVGSLLLARGTERRREIAIRLALGVSRRRLLRLLFVETAILAACGGLLALVLARWGIALLHATLLSDFVWTESAFDGRVVAAAATLVVLTVCIAGVAPAFRASQPDLVESLKSGGREGGIGVSRLRTLLMTAQAALCVILVVGAALFVQSLRRAATVSLGYEPARVLAASMDVVPLGYELPQRLALYASLRDRIAALPGVAGAAVAATYPVQGVFRFGVSIAVPGRDSLPSSPDGLFPAYNTVSGGFFTALGIRIVDGRPIADSDVGTPARVAVVSDAMARAYWPGERAVGRCLEINADSVCTTVVGVAADVKEAIDRTGAAFVVYVPLSSEGGPGPNAVMVRARNGRAEGLIPAVRRAMQGTAQNLPYANVQSLDAMMAPQLRTWRTGASLFTLFGGLALVIAAIGLYSAISYTVAQRRHEFGVRMALGARIPDVVRLVMDQGIQAAVIGTVLGATAAASLGGVVAPLLFQTSPREPAAFALAAVVIVVVAALASFVPAWRASRVDPVAALRGE